MRPRLISVLPIAALVALTAPLTTPAAAQDLAPVRKWPQGDNQATIFLDRTYAGGIAETYDDYIGAQDSTLTGVSGGPFRFDAYCLDAGADIQRPTTPVDIRPATLFPLGLPGLPLGLTHGGAAAWLLNNNYSAAFSDNLESAALQLAIWEVVEDWDGTFLSIDLNAGNLRYLGNPSSAAITAAIFARANTMLSNWNGQQSQALWFDGLPNPNNANPQDLIGPLRTAPEPSALALLSLPLVGAILLRHRRGGRA